MRKKSKDNNNNNNNKNNNNNNNNYNNLPPAMALVKETSLLRKGLGDQNCWKSRKDFAPNRQMD